MREYDFTLKLNLKNLQADPDDDVEKLYAGGCDDVLIGVGKKGCISVSFIRETS
jgi:hypothetical protein